MLKKIILLTSFNRIIIKTDIELVIVKRGFQNHNCQSKVVNKLKACVKKCKHIAEKRKYVCYCIT